MVTFVCLERYMGAMCKQYLNATSIRLAKILYSQPVIRPLNISIRSRFGRPMVD